MKIIQNDILNSDWMAKGDSTLDWSVKEKLLIGGVIGAKTQFNSFSTQKMEWKIPRRLKHKEKESRVDREERRSVWVKCNVEKGGSRRRGKNGTRS